MTLSKSLSALALATLLAAPASAQCSCGDPMEFTTDTQFTEVTADLGSAPFPRQPMITVPQFDIAAAAAEHMTTTDQVNLVCARLSIRVNTVPTGTLTNGSGASCTANWVYNVQVAIYQNMQVPVPGTYYPAPNSGAQALEAGEAAILPMNSASSTFVFTETSDFTGWVGTGDLVWEADGLTFQSVSGCSPTTSSFANVNTTTYSVTYTYCVPNDPPPTDLFPFCFGDGSGTACPCGNASMVGAGQGCLNGTGMGGLLVAQGSSSLGANDLAFVASNLISGNPALLISGMNATNGGAGITNYDGLQCAGGGLVRHQTITPNAMGMATFGPMIPETGQFSPGQIRRFQVWYRSPGANSPCGTAANFTNGFEVHFTP